MLGQWVNHIEINKIQFLSYTKHINLEGKSLYTKSKTLKF